MSNYIINDIDQLRSVYASIAAGTDFAQFQNHLEVAEDTYLVPLTGTGWHGSMTGAYLAMDMEDPDNALFKMALQKARDIVAHFAVASFLKELGSKISNNGARVPWLADNRGLTLPEIIHRVETEIKFGFRAIENFIIFEEVYGDTVEPGWTANSGYLNIRQDIIYRTTQANAWSKLEGLLTLRALCPGIRYYFETSVKNELGADLWQALADHYQYVEGLLGAYLLVVSQTQEACLYYSLGVAFEQGKVKNTTEGISVVRDSETALPNISLLEQNKQTARYYKSRAKSLLTEIRNYCQLNAADLPIYLNSSQYFDPTGDDPRVFKNSSSSKSFGAF